MNMYDNNIDNLKNDFIFFSTCYLIMYYGFFGVNYIPLFLIGLCILSYFLYQIDMKKEDNKTKNRKRYTFMSKGYCDMV